MSLKSRTQRNIIFLDAKIEVRERELVSLKKLRFRMYGLLDSDERYLKRIGKEVGLKLSLINLHKEYYKRCKKIGSNKE